MNKSRFYRKKITKISLYLAIILAFIISVPSTLAGSEYTNLSSEATGTVVDKFTLHQYTCSKSAIAAIYNSDVGGYTDDLITDLDYIDNCAWYYADGTLDPTNYEVADGASVDPGSLLLLRVDYDYEATTGYSTINNMNLGIVINSDVLEPVYSSDGTTPYFNVNDNNTADQWYPNKKSGKNYNIQFTIDNVSFDTAHSALKAQYGSDSSYLNSHQPLIYYGLKVKSDAAAGTTFNYRIAPQPPEDINGLVSDIGYTYINPDGNASAENGANKVYAMANTIAAKVTGGTTSGDNTLSTLTVQTPSATYSPDSTTPFTGGSKTNKTYLYYVPNSVGTINFTAVANDSTATAVIGKNSSNEVLVDDDESTRTFHSINNSLAVGMNTFTISVTAANGDTENYTVNVYRLSNDASITSLTTEGITLTKSSDGLIYTGTTTYDDTATYITVTAKHQNAVVAVGDGTTTGPGNWTFTNSGDTLNERTVTVQADNCNSKYSSLTGKSCTTANYTIKIS